MRSIAMRSTTMGSCSASRFAAGEVSTPSRRGQAQGELNGTYCRSAYEYSVFPEAIGTYCRPPTACLHDAGHRRLPQQHPGASIERVEVASRLPENGRSVECRRR
jgi:hypothetical protein